MKKAFAVSGSTASHTLVGFCCMEKNVYGWPELYIYIYAVYDHMFDQIPA